MQKRYVAPMILGILCLFAYAKSKKQLPIVACQYSSIATPVQVDDTRPRITVWVHGTRIDTLLPDFAFIFARKEIDFVQEFQLGFCAITDVCKESYVQVAARVISDACPQLFPYEHFYQFGWGGDNNVPVRRRHGRELYYSLKELIAQYEGEYGITPMVTLISHSHGGNVVLHMVEAFDDDDNGKKITINRVILLACPVQKVTADYVNSALFKNVVNIYSKSDMIQILDPQWVQPFADISKGFLDKLNTVMRRPMFSGRTFKQSSHLTQLCVTWQNGAPWDDCLSYLKKKYIRFFKFVSDGSDFFNKKRGLAHIELELPFLLEHIPAILDVVDTHKGNTEGMQVNVQDKISLYL